MADAEGQAQETFWAFRKLFEMLGRERPLIVVIDDIHWAEATLLDLLEYLVSFSSDAAIVLLCLARQDLFDERPSWAAPRDNATLISLKPLSDEDAESLVDRLVAARQDLPTRLREQVVAAAEGNPLFVEQMLALQAENGEGTRVAIPPTIEALLAARIDRLPLEERAVVERASVEGRAFHRGAVAELLPTQAQSALDAVLMSLVRKELIRPDRAAFAGDDGFRFVHVLVRDAAYESISKEVRAKLHERFAGWLERVAGEHSVEYEEILGYHLEQAYRYRAELGPVAERGQALAGRAAAMLASAGRRAFARGDSSAAASLLQRATALLAIDDPTRVELLPVFAEALGELGDYARAEAVLEEAVESAAELGDERLRAHAIVGLELQRVRTSPDPEGHRERVEPAIAVFEAAGDDLGLARSWRLLAYLPYIQARAAETEAALWRAVDHARRAGARLEEAQNLIYLIEHGRHGDIPLEEGLRRCEEFLGRVDSRWLEADLLVNRSIIEAQLGRLEQGRSSLADAGAIFEEIGSQYGLMGVEWLLGLIELYEGDPASAERHLRRSYEATSEIGEHLVASRAALDLGSALFAQGKNDEAERLSQAVREWAPAVDRVLQAGWRSLQGLVLARRGEFEDAERLAREAVAVADESDWLQLQADRRLELAEVLRLAGRSEEALSVLAEALRLYERKGNVVSARKVRASLEELQATTP